MPLVTTQGFRLSPDIVGSIGRGFQLGAGIRQTQQQEEQQRAEAARQQEEQELLRRAAGIGQPAAQVAPPGAQPGIVAPQQPFQAHPGATPPIVAPQAPGPAGVSPQGRQQALARLMVLRPEIGEQVLANLNAFDERTRNELATATLGLSEINPADRPAEIQRRADSFRAKGLDPAPLMELLQMTPAQQDAALETTQLAALSPADRAKVAQGADLKAFAPVPMAGGGLGFPVFDPSTGRGRVEPLPGAVAEEPITALDRAKLNLRERELEVSQLRAQEAAETNELTRKNLQSTIEKREEGIKTERRKLGERRENTLNTIDTVVNKVDQALAASGFTTTGLTGAVLAKVPGTPAFDLTKTVDTIRANLGFTELQKMRDASPTGGALGQVAVKEIDFLQSTIASLDPAQGQETFERNLEEIKASFQRWRSAVNQDIEAAKEGRTPAEAAPTGQVGRFTVEVVE